YRDGVLCVEEIPVEEIAEWYGTPLYVYSAEVLEKQYRRLEDSLGGLAENVLICYALKANANPVLGGMLAGWGAGADVVSGGEIYMARKMGFHATRIVFAGVGKTRREMAEALDVGVRAFHVESAGELEALASVAEEMGKVAPVAVRINPDVEADTHPYITTGTKANKFGVSPSEAANLIRQASGSQSLRPVGLHAHIGSQLPKVQPVIEATRCLLELWDLLASEGIQLHELDIGGGLGITYKPGEQPEGPEALASGLRPLLAGRKLDLVLEPGRFIVGPAGALLTSVLYVKQTEAVEGQTHTFVVVDAGMNDLLRPSLYSAWHPVWTAKEADMEMGEPVDIVGPVCESSDVLAHERRLGKVRPGDVLAVGQTGAYGFSMASNYNGRPRPAEVLVRGRDVRVIRERETYEDLR
ncbi:MAG: diaminopimelate decarboxylase, partial [Chloroflexia bacterium]